ncbi:MAG TPA: cytochrome c oxidase subunit 3 [Candidatus Limnocylindrales bacterium]|nr:cytochrome c oxidase subunit 3 [Candidatus Limnocylindrales bacterium]
MTSDSHALTTTEHSPVAGLAHDAHGGISNPILGMLLFITSEVMFFAGLFAAYFASRAAVAPWPPAEFEHALEPFSLVFPATVMLVISSVTCQIGVNAIRRDDRAGFIRAIGLTLILGIVFLLIQVYDYGLLYAEGLTVAAGPYGTTYYTLTGFHGAHVFGGVIMLAVILYRGMAGQFSSRHHDAVEATSIYWHFVDVVWIGLYTTLYWLR